MLFHNALHRSSPSPAWQPSYSLPVAVLDALLAMESCAVCLEAFEGGQAVRLLPSCGHIFHAATCVDPWLLHSATCPLCRTVALPMWVAEALAS